MGNNDVCAVIVTFRPPSELLANLARARPQFQGFVVVDNGSSPEALASLAAASTQLDFELIQNRTNLGQAAALNIGVQKAISRGFKWVVLFDQDSIIEDGFVVAMLQEYESNLSRERIAIVTPIHLELETGEWDRPFPMKDGTPLTAITSGSLMPVEIFEHCGFFEEDLVIDSVDTEYCLRARWMGYTIALCKDAFLHHSVGTPRMHSFFGLFMAKATHHSPKRHYYMTRNRIVIMKRYARLFPEWGYLTPRSLIRDIVVNLVIETDRLAKLANTLRGIFDGLCGRMGMRVQL